MMTHTDPNASMKAVGGLGVFVAVAPVIDVRWRANRASRPAVQRLRGERPLGRDERRPSNAAGYHGEPSAAAGFFRTCISCAGM